MPSVKPSRCTLYYAEKRGAGAITAAGAGARRGRSHVDWGRSYVACAARA